MKQHGSQIRETLAEAGYKLEKIRGETGDVIVTSPDGKLELWTENDDYAGYVLEIEGTGYEFVRTL